MGGKSKKGRKVSSTKPQSCSQTEASTVEQFEKVFSRIAKSASKGKSIVRVEVRELKKKSDHCTTEMALTLFDGSVMTGHIPATVNSGDDHTFVTSYTNRVIAPALIGHEPTRQDSIDAMLTQFLNDASKDLSDKFKKLARNVNWATSVAVCKAGAYAHNMHSYKYVRKLLVSFDSDFKGEDYEIPNYVFSVNNSATITSAPQHLLISHKRGTSSNRECFEITKGLYDSYFKDKIAKGEPSYTPCIQDIKKGLEELTKIIDHLGYKEKVSIGLDVGASQFYESNDSNYRFQYSDEEDKAHDLISAKALNDFQKSLLKEYDVEYIEDAFHRTHWDYFSSLNHIVGVVTTVVSAEKWKLIYDYVAKLGQNRVSNSLLLKVRSVSELIKFANLINYCSLSFVMDSHSCCESNEPFIADLCVGLMVDSMKIGVSCVTSNCNVCDQVNRIINTFPTVRLLNVFNGRIECEIDGPDDEDEWDKPDDIDD